MQKSFPPSVWSVAVTRQDGQGFRLHVTIQNKVHFPEAKALFEEL